MIYNKRIKMNDVFNFKKKDKIIFYNFIISKKLCHKKYHLMSFSQISNIPTLTFSFININCIDVINVINLMIEFLQGKI